MSENVSVIGASIEEFGILGFTMNIDTSVYIPNIDLVDNVTSKVPSMLYSTLNPSTNPVNTN